MTHPAGTGATAKPSLAAMLAMFVATSLAMIGNYYVYDSIGPVAELLSRQCGRKAPISSMRSPMRIGASDGSC